MKFLRIDSNYYSFKLEKIKFIVLNTCFIKTDNGYEPYCRKKYDKSKDIYPVLPDYEYKWLEESILPVVSSLKAVI